MSSDLEVTFLGHATFLVELGDVSILIDPWLEGNPAFPDGLEPTDVAPDLVVITHGHNDHIGDAVALAERCDARFFTVHEIGKWLGSKGIESERIAGANRGGSLRYDELGVTLTLTDARHSSAYVDSDGSVTYLGEPCGVVITFDAGPAVYHAGDTSLFGDMALIGEIWSPAVAILPIGDRYTMDPRQAAHAARLVGAETVIPCHFGTFPLLTGTPSQFRDELERLGVAVSLEVLAPGASYSPD